MTQDPIQAATARHAAALDAVSRYVQARAEDLVRRLAARGYTPQSAAEVASELADDWFISALCETLQAEIIDRDTAARDTDREENQ